MIFVFCPLVQPESRRHSPECTEDQWVKRLSENLEEEQE